MTNCMDREEYCKKYCLSKNKRCDKENCFIWRTPIAVISLVTDGWRENDNPICPNCGAKMDGGADHEDD